MWIFKVLQCFVVLLSWCLLRSRRKTVLKALKILFYGSHVNFFLPALLLSLSLTVFSEGIFIDDSTISSPMRPELFQMHHCDVANIEKIIERNKKKLISDRGFYHVDKGLNQIWIYDDRQHLGVMAQMIHGMDRPTHQVSIVAHIINVDADYLQQMGGALSQSGLVDISADHMLSMPLATLAEHQLRYQIDALVEKGHAKIIAAPKVMTQNRQEAIIEAGSEVPYQEKTGTGNTSVTFKKAVMSLGVIPIILPDHHIVLKVRVNEDQVGGLVVNGVPVIKTQKLITQAIVKDQHTLLIGGISQKTRSQSHRGIPIIGHLPILGWLLSRYEKRHSEHQLIVLIQPTIVS